MGNLFKWCNEEFQIWCNLAHLIIWFLMIFPKNAISHLEIYEIFWNLFFRMRKACCITYQTGSAFWPVVHSVILKSLNSVFDDFTQKCIFSLNNLWTFLKFILEIRERITFNISNKYCCMTCVSCQNDRWGRTNYNKNYTFWDFSQEMQIFNLFLIFMD